ncbi:hypothetical protein RCJ22_29490, partial [Vibrio sp. FNV 38]|nr:hypothetical protein [Vibrio sp. FNV 38]
ENECMFYLTRCFIVIFTVFILAGCKVEFIGGNTGCTTVDNRDIDGSFGYRDVYRYDSGNEARIGYSYRGRQVLHSECAPALTTTRATETRFEWYEFGRSILKDGITSLRFYNVNSRTNLHAISFVSDGVPTEEYSEKAIGSSKTPTRTKLIYLGDFPYDTVEVSDNFNQDGIKQVFAAIGQTQKTQRWNDNTQQFDCLYNSASTDRFDAGCANEDLNDQEFFQQDILLLPYFDELTRSFRYETNESSLMRQVNRY